MDLIRNLLSLLLFFCVAALLLYVGVAIFLVALVVGAIAAVWYGIKFYFIRKELKEVIHEYEDTRFHSATRRNDAVEGEVIDGDFVEVEPEDDTSKTS